MNPTLIKRTIFKNTTPDGHLTKLRVAHYTTDNHEAVVMIQLVLTDSPEPGFYTLKEFKGKYLICKMFGLQTKSLKKILDWVNKESSFSV